jgi:hypothetical protein
MFRFTIRDVLWLMALVAIGAAWWADRTRLVKLNEDIRGWVWQQPGLNKPPYLDRQNSN